MTYVCNPEQGEMLLLHDTRSSWLGMGNTDLGTEVFQPESRPVHVIQLCVLYFKLTIYIYIIHV